jgi:hypothetical protein
VGGDRELASFNRLALPGSSAGHQARTRRITELPLPTRRREVVYTTSRSNASFDSEDILLGSRGGVDTGFVSGASVGVQPEFPKAIVRRQVFQTALLD